MQKPSSTISTVRNGCLVYEQQNQRVVTLLDTPSWYNLVGNGDGLRIYLRGGRLYRAQSVRWQSARRVVLARLSPQARTTLSLLSGHLIKCNVVEALRGGSSAGASC